MEYLINPRDKGENEQTYQDAVGLLRVNAVNESNAKIGDTILLASGVGEIAAAAKAAPVFLKGFFSTTGKTLTEKSSSLVSATRQGAAKAESRALDDTAETVVSSSSQDVVGNASTTGAESVVPKSVGNVGDFMADNASRLNKKLGKKIGRGRLPFERGKEGIEKAKQTITDTLNNSSAISKPFTNSNGDKVFDVFSEKTGFTVRVREGGVFDTLIDAKTDKF